MQEIISDYGHDIQIEDPINNENVDNVVNVNNLDSIPEETKE